MKKIAILLNSPIQNDNRVVKIIRLRFNDEKINKIEHSKWLEKDIEVIINNKDKSSEIDTFLM
jgi:hypothetical protein